MSDIQSRLVALSADQFAVQTGLNTSNRYRPIDTKSLVESVVQRLGLNASIDSITNWRNKSTKHAVVLTLSQPVMLAGTACFPRIYVRNSYAGESALTVRIGFFRLVCSNGMMVGSMFFDGRIRHVQSGVDKLDQLIESVQSAVDYCTLKLPEIAEQMNAVVLSKSQVEIILTSIGASKRLSESVLYKIEHPSNIRAADKQADGSLSAWNVWNVINEQGRIGSRSVLHTLERDAKLFEAVQSVQVAA